ncbi:MAG: hypothetical protein WA001_01410 [Patescibacteria group bacterium]
MNPYRHAQHLAAELKKLTHKDFSALVEARKPLLDKEKANAVITEALRSFLASYLTARVCTLLIPDKELFEIQKEAQLVRELSRGRRGGLERGVAAYLDLLAMA